MAFVSQHHGRGNRGPAGISVKFSKSGSTTCCLSTKVRGGARFVEVELDEVTMQIRVKCGSESGAKIYGVSGGQFSLSKSFARKVVPPGEVKTHISLNLSDDGWWYGSYDKTKKEGKF